MFGPSSVVDRGGHVLPGQRNDQYGIFFPSWNRRNFSNVHVIPGHPVVVPQPFIRGPIHRPVTVISSGGSPPITSKWTGLIAAIVAIVGFLFLFTLPLVLI